MTEILRRLPRAAAIAMLAGTLEVCLVLGNDPEAVDQPSELFSGFAIGFVLYALVCWLVALPAARRVIRLLPGIDDDLAEKIGVLAILAAIAALAAQDLIGFNLISLQSAGGILRSLAAGAVMTLVLGFSRETVQQSFSRWFDPFLFAAAAFSAAFLPWIAVRPDRSAAYNFFSLDGLVTLGLFGLAVFAARKLSSQWLATGMGSIALLLTLAGAIAFYSYSPFLHFASANETAVRRKIPRVILISIDTLRRDSVSCYGSGPGTPNIDHIADDAVLFENAYSAAPWTVPSLVSIHTGVPFFVHGISNNGLQVPEAFNTLAERMSEAGYHSGAVISNPAIHPNLNLTQGFADYFCSLADIEYTFPANEPIGRKVLRKLAPERFAQSTTVITDMAIGWLNANQTRDFFLWVHYFDPHHPYTPPEQFRINKQVYAPDLAADADTAMLTRRERVILKQHYDGEVRYVDHELGRLTAAIKSLGLYDDSLIILTSDHGEEFWEHGHLRHGQSLYNELIQVPLLIKLPGSIAHRKVASPVSNQFLMGTILELAGLPPSDEKFELPSLAPLLEGRESAKGLPPVVAGGTTRVEEMEALVSGNHKIINRLASGRSELYDVNVDRAETIDLSGQDAPTRDYLIEYLREEKARLDNVRKAANITVRPSANSSPEQLRRLKALGYIQ